MLNVLIPMAGEGSRFKKEGFSLPKPFIDINGKPMIARVIENLPKISNVHYILVARAEHLRSEPMITKKIIDNYAVTFVEIDQLTEGTACSVLYARSLIDNDDSLLIANSDQLVDYDLKLFLLDANSKNLDGSILTFRDEKRDPKWSFVKINNNGLVEEVKEKQAISDIATVGIYWFKKGSFFVDAAIDMICRNDRVNNEFYTCPVYNYMIRSGLKIGTHDIDYKQMHGIGTPKDLEHFLKFNHHLLY